MADPQKPPQEDSGSRPPEETPQNRRKRGYRGYPNNPGSGGDVHSGTGFGGAGSVGRTSNPVDRKVISDRTREDVEKE